ncbi:hypothetical protein [Alteromonas sp. P256]|uniref:hypothetical protein n=1 Tax=Alteromonas sp. P256 TaxID=3117399 RepID=UPI002FE2D707
MSRKVTPRKCSECGKRRMPAKRSNGRLSTKCKDCFGGQFWQSEFGRWFAEAAKRQSPVSMPIDENDIKGIHGLWKERKKGTGFKRVRGQLKPIYDYHISHRDPAKGDGFQGRFTTANLMVATAKANKMAYNKESIDHGFRVYTNKRPFETAAKVREWSSGQYDLTGLVGELELKKYVFKKNSIVDINSDFLPQGKPPQTMLEHQLNRFKGGSTEPWRHTVSNANESFSSALVYGIGLGSGELDESYEGPQELSVDDF